MTVWPGPSLDGRPTDVRLAVDVVEDLFRLPSITHVVVVAEDSDYIYLAQRAKRLDRYVVGIGVAGSVSSSLADACSEFANYDDLPGVEKPTKRVAPVETVETKTAPVPAESSRKLHRDCDKAAALLNKALDFGEKDDDNWQHGSAVKLQMKRINPKFNEKAIEYRSFMKFVASRPKLVEVKEIGQTRVLRLR